MNSRVDLQMQLEAVLGSRNVYFQPPETLKIKYPAIIYELSGIDITKADNSNYLKHRNYLVTLIHSDPDNDLVDKLLDHFLYIGLDRPPYESDNLYHYVFDLYF